MGANQCIKRFIIHGKLPLKYIFIVLHLTSKKHHHFWKSVFAYSLRSTALTRALFANWARGHGPWALWAMQNQSSIAGVFFAVKKHFWLLNSGRPSLRGNNLDDVCPTGTTVLVLRKKKACQAKDPKPQPSEGDPGSPASNFMSLVRRIPPLLPSALQSNPHILLAEVMKLIGASIFQISTFS